jgi:hypothetical protein
MRRGREDKKLISTLSLLPFPWIIFSRFYCFLTVADISGIVFSRVFYLFISLYLFMDGGLR